MLRVAGWPQKDLILRDAKTNGPAGANVVAIARKDRWAARSYDRRNVPVTRVGVTSWPLMVELMDPLDRFVSCAAC